LQGVPPTANPPRAIGTRSILLVLVGAVLVLVSFRFLDWYDVPHGRADSTGDVTFSSLHSSAEQLGGAGVALAYFSWLSWALLIAVIVLGVWAALPTRAADGLRVAAFLVGLAGAVGTYYALRQHFNATGSTRNLFYHSTWGVWAALAGYLIAAIGAVLGPRRDR
jgi:hypothetical protein